MSVKQTQEREHTAYAICTGKPTKRPDSTPGRFLYAFFIWCFSHTFCAGNSGQFLIKTWTLGGMVGLWTGYSDKEPFSSSGQNTNKSPTVHNNNYITALSRNHCKTVIYGVYAKFYLERIDYACNKNRPYGRFYLFCGILLLLR